MRAATAPRAELGTAGARVCRHIEIQGQVQGVGFRPFVYKLARGLALGGYVTNTSAGVRIEVEGDARAVGQFTTRLERERPALATINRLDTQEAPCEGRTAFVIHESDRCGTMRSLVLPDIATCADCLREVNDPRDRRYQYPFTNCTNCGPRYSIIEGMPYDRPYTTMAGFDLCDECRREYEDPADRRFHAQPIACPDCGPHLECRDAGGTVRSKYGGALNEAVAALDGGAIVALKGLGGFQLLVDAGNERAVAELRARKRREGKPFALMFPNLDNVRAACDVTDVHAGLLQSPQAPIVLIPARENAAIAPAVAPDTYMLAAMLPYTPLHHLILAAFGRPLVVTSGNLGEEPICIDNEEALERLAGIADLFLVHDRPIARQVDDSIVSVIHGEPMVLRRARGYAPAPVAPSGAMDGTLAAGGHLKNTVAFVKAGAIFPSQHIGNLENAAALDAFHRTADSMTALFEVSPRRVVHDLHPDYASTRFAQALGIPATAIQHHYAHVLSCMAEHGLEGPVLGVAWDGTGYGADGTIWGSEFLRCTRAGFQRLASLRPFHLPGGDASARDPRRPALSLLREAFGEDLAGAHSIPALEALDAGGRRVLEQMLDKNINTPVTTSMGRIFDAVASLCGLCHHNAFEGQAAMRLERAAVQWAGEPVPLALLLEDGGDRWLLDWRPMIRDIVTAVLRGTGPGAIALGFHHALAEAIVRVVGRSGVNDVVLTGGCFQNTLLLEQGMHRLSGSACTVYTHRDVPPNDGGISVGQAWYKPDERPPSCV